MNKIDVTRLEDLSPENRALVDEIINSEGVLNVQVSCYTDEGVMELKNKACDALMEHRVDTKLKGNKINTILNRLHVAQPKARDDVVREPFIPDVVKQRKKYDKEDPERRRLEKDLEAEDGGAGVYNINMKSEFLVPLFKRSPFLTPVDLQRITCLRTPNGKRISFQKSWMARISQTSSTQISSRSSKLSRGKKRNYRRTVSTIPKKIW